MADVPEAVRRLMGAFWPGPLTLLLPRSAAVPDAVVQLRGPGGNRRTNSGDTGQYIRTEDRGGRKEKDW